MFAEPPYGEDAELNRPVFVERVKRYHATKPHARLIVATAGDELAGFALGHGAGTGDWWRDRVSGVLSPESAERWLGVECFSVAELAVARPHRRSGVAAQLMHALCDGLPYRTAILGCYSEAVPARAFYRSQGWEDIAIDVRIGDSPELCILARDLDTAG